MLAAEPSIKAHLSDTDDKVLIVRRADGTHRFILDTRQGPVEMTAEQFARRVYDEQRSHGWWMGFLNISTPIGMAWVGLGLLGQLLFTGRMLVQWFVSEKHKKSVVPVAFWWMSLGGAAMLTVYFVWRNDPIGVLGQALGWVIYVRNLWLIYFNHPPQITQDPAPEPELE